MKSLIINELVKYVYELSKKNLNKDINLLNAEISHLEKNSSNQVSIVNRAILTACKLEDLWKNGSYKNRQNLQYLVFPDGLIWDKETGKLRTFWRILRCWIDLRKVLMMN